VAAAGGQVGHHSREAFMTISRFSTFTAVGFAFMLASTIASAQAPTRVRGTIEQVDGNTLSIKSKDGAMLKVVLADNAVVLAIEKRSLADIKPGVFIGTAATSEATGTLRAMEVHIFPENMRGTGEGHRDWEGPKSSMTNATVDETVRGVDGNTFTLKYKGGEQKVMVTEQTPIVAYVPGDRSDLKVGKAIFIPAATRAEDGTLRAPRISVERTAPPPM
jgi:uncharacterized protein DUF5666